MEPRELTIDQWVDFTHDYPDHVHFVGGLNHRVGVISLASVVEYYDFPPDTLSNDEFEFNIVEWEDQPWCVFSVPRYKKETVVERAKQMTLKIAKAPPSFLKCGPVTTLFSAKPGLSVEEIIEMLGRGGMPKLLSLGSPHQTTFPGPVADTFAIEYKAYGILANKSPGLSLQRLKNRENTVADANKRELSLQALFIDGYRPNPLLIIKYIVGELPLERLLNSGKRRRAHEPV